MLHDELDIAIGALPSRHILRAALLAAHALTRSQGTELAQLPASWSRTPTDGVYSADQLSAGFALLVEARFIAVVGSLAVPAVQLASLIAQPEDEACKAILLSTIEVRSPLWLSGVTDGTAVAAELIPDDAATALTEILPDPEERERFLLTLGQRYSSTRATRTGQLAEIEAAEACRRELRQSGRHDLASLVRRVSLTSDQLGYDLVAPRIDSSPRRIEVKGTRLCGPRLMLTITRNEANVAARDADWFLVVCRVQSDDSVTVLGWTTNALLEPRLPVDRVERGGWRSTVVPFDEGELAPHLPPCGVTL